MRRAEREIRELDQILEIVDRCQVCRLAIAAKPAPYLVPLSYGWEHRDGALRMYFHCAGEGRKLDLLRENPLVGFEMDGPQTLLEGPEACDYSLAYESLIGTGTVTVVEDLEEKRHALELLMAHYTPEKEQNWTFPEPMLRAVCVLRLDCGEFTAKAHKQ